LNDGQKRTRVQLAVSLQAGLERAQRRNWTEFCTGDESRVSWKNFPKGWWLSLDQELPERVRQTIRTETSIFTVFQSEWFRSWRSSATRDRFSAQYFTDQILKPFSHSAMNIPRNGLILLPEVCDYTLTILAAIRRRLCQRK
jgi:hypothetical protein